MALEAIPVRLSKSSSSQLKITSRWGLGWVRLGPGSLASLRWGRDRWLRCAGVGTGERAGNTCVGGLGGQLAAAAVCCPRNSRTGNPYGSGYAAHQNGPKHSVGVGSSFDGIRLALGAPATDMKTGLVLGSSASSWIVVWSIRYAPLEVA